MSQERIIMQKELAIGQLLSVKVADELILLARNENGEIFAVEDSCSHEGGGFEGGTISDTVLTCPRHGATFNICSGEALTMPAVAPIKTYKVNITDDGWVELDTED